MRTHDRLRGVPPADRLLPLVTGSLGPSGLGYAGFALGLLVLSAATVGLGRWAGVGLGLFPLWALVRAGVQLTVVALLLRGILSVPETAAAFVVLMLSTASWTAVRRADRLWHGRRASLVGVLAGSSVSVSAVFLLRLVDADARTLLAVSGIVIGSAMSASTLAGRNFLRGARARSAEIEAWLSLGATPSVAHRAIGQDAVRDSLVPNLDQTKSTGLVTLPGAFVGALFGGASPAAAAQFQLVVLAGIALAMTVTGIVVTRIAARSPLLTVEDP